MHISDIFCNFALSKVFTIEDNFAIQLFEGKKVRIVWDEEQEKYYFAVADIVQVLTDSVDAKQYIKRLRMRDSELNLRWGTICTPTEMRAADGKRYKTQAADLQGIFRIIQLHRNYRLKTTKRTTNLTYLRLIRAQRTKPLRLFFFMCIFAAHL